MNSPEINTEPRPAAGKARCKLLIGAAGLIALLMAARVFDAQSALRDTLDWISSRGALGAAVYVAIYIVACVLLVPGSILSLGAGAVYGVVKGTMLVSVAATLGATAAFLAGRYLARDWVAGKFAGNARFRAIDDAVGREGWKIVGLTRLSPVFPFNLLNYAFGITKVRLRDYFFASWIGMLPGAVLFVYIGSLAGDLARAGASGRERTPVEWAFYALGLAATLGVTVYVTKLAKRALKEKITGQ